MKTKFHRLLLVALALCVALLPALALADSGSDSAGNVLASEADAAGKAVAGDLYCFGQNIDASGAQIAESAILAGQNISVNNATVGGSLRAAGYQISANGTAVAVNATLAGYGISLGNGFTAKGVYGAASSITFAGACEALALSAQTVTVSGTVNGDAYISAETVTVADGAVITGTLHVDSANAPAIAEGASVGELNYVPDTSAQDAMQTVSAVSPVISKLKNLLMMLPGRILLAALYYLIIRKSVDEAANMVKTRPAAMPVSGLIALISAPLAAILLMVTVIGVPAGSLVLCLYTLAVAFAVSFAGCMLGRLFFPKLHPILAYIIGAAGITVIKLIPFVGGLVTFASMVYTLGYFIQKIYLNFPKKPAVEPPVQAESIAAPQEAAASDTEPSAQA